MQMQELLETADKVSELMKSLAAVCDGEESDERMDDAIALAIICFGGIALARAVPDAEFSDRVLRIARRLRLLRLRTAEMEKTDRQCRARFITDRDPQYRPVSKTTLDCFNATFNLCRLAGNQIINTGKLRTIFVAQWQVQGQRQRRQGTEQLHAHLSVVG